METPLEILMEKNRRFGMHKTYGLSEECFKCPYVKLCFGGCPKDRLWENKNYLCEGYKMFFRHTDPYMRYMRTLIEKGEPASLVMQWQR